MGFLSKAKELLSASYATGYMLAQYCVPNIPVVKPVLARVSGVIIGPLAMGVIKANDFAQETAFRWRTKRMLGAMPEAEPCELNLVKAFGAVHFKGDFLSKNNISAIFKDAALYNLYENGHILAQAPGCPVSGAHPERAQAVEDAFGNMAAAASDALLPSGIINDWPVKESAIVVVYKDEAGATLSRAFYTAHEIFSIEEMPQEALLAVQTSYINMFDPRDVTGQRYFAVEKAPENLALRSAALPVVDYKWALEDPGF